ncbi:hypothetical protein PSE_0396 [Pseudovibrio sp. FO-BEG1]|nr:hypothetical protein PSE_0396 [Pseudovibrio sp. FO-BEG1]
MGCHVVLLVFIFPLQCHSEQQNAAFSFSLTSRGKAPA